jgi:dihydroorotate dehydrogenase (NAD+) catalytic subunit
VKKKMLNSSPEERVIHAFGTQFQNPVLLAAGTAGFGREIGGIVDIRALGGLVTKAVSPTPRSGNPAPRVAEFHGGMLNSVGLANPGMEAVAEKEIPWLSENVGDARVIVNVVGDKPEDYAAVVRRLTDHEVIAAFELNVSCPNTEKGGEEFGADDGVLTELVSRAASETDKPLIAKLAPTLSDIAATAETALEAGASGLSLINTIPGFLYEDSAAETPRLGRGQGGVSGPPLLPVGILAVRKVVERTGAPVIGVGGVRTIDDLRQYLAAGAVLVAIGTAALANPRLPERIAREWNRHV